ncbi:MAG: hypothetical protein U0Q12_17330 [Vicinamibacterales bacterium]
MDAASALDSSTPAASGDELKLAKVAGEFVVRLNRAVQRATIYPAGHPAVRQSVGPLVESLAALCTQVRQVVLFVSREVLLLACDRQKPESQVIPWLSTRLSERGLASLTFSGALVEADAAALVSWLALPPADRAPSPSIGGLIIAWRDYSQARFSEHAVDGSEGADALLMWQRVVHGLAADWLHHAHAGAGDLLEGGSFERINDDPTELAKFVRNTLLTQEGTGISAVTERIVAVGGRLATLEEPGRSLVRRRLAAFIAELAPELRGQLLRVAPGEAPEKYELLSEVIDELPRVLVLEVIQNMEVGAGRNPQPFVTLLTKMVTLSTEHADFAPVLSQSLTRAGLPADVLDQDPAQLRSALEQVLSTPVDDASMSDAYRQELDALAARRLEAVGAFDHTRFLLPNRPEHLAVEVPKIAVSVLLASPLGSDAAALLARATGAAEAALDAGDLELLIGLAKVASVVATAPAVNPDELAIAQAAMHFFEQPAAVTLLMDATADVASPLHPDAGAMFRAGGLHAATEAMLRLSGQASTVVRDRLTGLLAGLHGDALKAALAHARTDGRIPAKVVLSVLCHRDVANAPELAELFFTDSDHDLRVQAYRVLFGASLTATKFERILRRALADDDPQVVELAIGEVRHRQAATASARALGNFLCRIVSPKLAAAQRTAMAVLVDAHSPAAREALVSALAARGRAWDVTSRRVSRRLTVSLTALGDAESLAAARAWWWTPAGLLSFVMRDQAEAA